MPSLDIHTRWPAPYLTGQAPAESRLRRLGRTARSVWSARSLLPLLKTNRARPRRLLHYPRAPCEKK